MQQRTRQKVEEDFSKQMWSSRIIQTLTDSEVFILFAEINQILFKISFILILIHEYLVALYQKTEL